MSSTSTRDTGEKVLIGGLVVQLLSFGLFFTTSVIFELRLRKRMLFRRSTDWRILLYFLFAAAGLIICRCIYRLVEAGQGVHGYLASHEAYIYAFEGFPMFVVQVMFHFCPPVKALGCVKDSSKSVYVEMDSEAFDGLEPGIGYKEKLASKELLSPLTSASFG